MESPSQPISRRHQVIALVAVLAVLVLVVIAVAYQQIEAQRQRAKTAEELAALAQHEAELAQTLAATATADAKRVSSQAAPEFVSKAARALQAWQWEVAGKAVATAIEMDPKLGAARFEQARVRLQAGDFADASTGFAQALTDAALDADRKARGERLKALADRHAQRHPAAAVLAPAECTQLGQDLRQAGEAVLAAWFLQLGGRNLEAAQTQIAAAAAALKQANPELGKLNAPIFAIDGSITWWLNSQPKLTDLSALAGLPLTTLNLADSPVADLSPLLGMPLAELNLTHTAVVNLAPLQGMPLRRLNLTGLTAPSLAPLAGAPLEGLDAGNLRLSDLSVLSGMPLRWLGVCCDARDLAALRDLPLEHLVLGNAGQLEDVSALGTLKNLRMLQIFLSPISDLSALAGLPLERLDLLNCPNVVDLSFVKKLPQLRALNLGQADRREDLSALAGLPLTSLMLDRTRVGDLSPLKGMPLKALSVPSYQPMLDYSVLKDMPLEHLTVGWFPERYNTSVVFVPDTLGFLRGKTSLKTLQFGLGRDDLAAYYEQVLPLGQALGAANPDYRGGVFYRLTGGQVTEVWLTKCPVRDLAPLKGRPLTRLVVDGAPVADLAPVAGLPLQRVSLKSTAVTDLAPLRGAPLVALDLTGTPVSDLAPLAAAPLEDLVLTGTKVTDVRPLAGGKLRRLWLEEPRAAAIAGLRELKTLAQINDQPAEEFWRAHPAAVKPN